MASGQDSSATIERGPEPVASARPTTAAPGLTYSPDKSGEKNEHSSYSPSTGTGEVCGDQSLEAFKAKLFPLPTSYQPALCQSSQTSAAASMSPLALTDLDLRTAQGQHITPDDPSLGIQKLTLDETEHRRESAADTLQPTSSKSRSPQDVLDFCLAPTSGTTQSETEADIFADSFFTRGVPQANNFISQFRRSPRRVDEIVKIAVIDTGICFDHPLFQTYKLNGQFSPSFWKDFVADSPVPMDQNGHGTHIAHTILQVFPSAQMYIARAFEGAKATTGTTTHVKEAIDHATKIWKVDIVCMAFSFLSYQRPIHEAISNARVVQRNGRTRHVLFFAAALNNRHDEINPVGFPASADEVISVYSCTYSRKRSDFSPIRTTPSLAASGERVKAAVPIHLGTDPACQARMSGTSMATAKLAGIAGLVLEYAKLKGGTERGIESLESTDALWHWQGMKSVFMDCMAGDPDGNYYCIEPWRLFRMWDGHGRLVSDVGVSVKLTESLSKFF
ncbi:subtilase family protein [Sarocladium implicatum]|nr:subtilase family protein [Sarocladium implicatum]